MCSGIGIDHRFYNHDGNGISHTGTIPVDDNTDSGSVGKALLTQINAIK